MPSVAIFGGGVAGLSAAQELARFGLEVDVYEKETDFGGKAKNQISDSLMKGSANNRDFLGEHGFRFFPGFYRNLIATMGEIPNTTTGQRVTEDLVESDEAGLANPGVGIRSFLRRISMDRPWEVYSRLQALYSDLGFEPEDIARMAWFRLKYATSGHDRRNIDYEDITWWEFIDGKSERYTDAFKLFEASIPSTMSALVAETSSARVIGDITMQFMLGPFRTYEKPDRLLTGSTLEKWLGPWVEYLDGKPNIHLHNGHTLNELVVSGDYKRIEKAVVSNGLVNDLPVVADYYLVAVPVEVMKRDILSNPDLSNDPNLKPLADRPDNMTSDMVGAQFLLKRDEAMVKGHMFYPQSEWALSSISQGQFWVPPIRDNYGDGSIEGILSVVISDWETASSRGKVAGEMRDKDAVLDEVLEQLREAVDGSGIDLGDQNIAGKHLDDAISFDTANATGRTVINGTPLLVHPVGANHDRPLAHNAEGIANLFLAADYVKTSTSLASMEAANEAARRASKAILIANGMNPNSQMLPKVWELEEDDIFTAAKELDDRRFAQGKGHIMDEFPVTLGLEVPAVATKVLELLMSAPAVLLSWGAGTGE